MKIKLYLFLMLSFLIKINCSFGQFINVEQEMFFQSKINNAITVDVITQGDKYMFYAQNRSFYPYILNINFSELKNLTPETVNKDFTVLTGKNNLFTLTVKDKEASHTYKYQITYRIGVPSKNVMTDFPYLIPLGTDKTIKFKELSDNSNNYIKDCFAMQKGDTVFSMRKGYIAAVPDMFNNFDRISGLKSLEIIHNDGTIMVYENIDPENVFVKSGTNIYPGDPLGLIGNELALEVQLYKIEEGGRLTRLDKKYVTGINKVESFSPDFKNIKIVHPYEVVTKEMSKREINKYKKNNIL